MGGKGTANFDRRRRVASGLLLLACVCLLHVHGAAATTVGHAQTRRVALASTPVAYNDTVLSDGSVLLPCPVPAAAVLAAATMFAAGCTSDGQTACRSCMPAAVSALQSVGVPVDTSSTLILPRGMYNVVQACVRQNSDALAALGVNSSALDALKSCPVPPAQNTLTATLTVTGIQPANVSRTALSLAVASVTAVLYSGQVNVGAPFMVGASAPPTPPPPPTMNASSSPWASGNATRPPSAPPGTAFPPRPPMPAAGRRRLSQQASGFSVLVTIDASTLAARAAYSAALTYASQNGTLLAAMQSYGVPATAVNRTDAGAADALMPPPGASVLVLQPVAQLSPSTSHKVDAIVGLSVGMPIGMTLLSMGACVWWHRRQARLARVHNGKVMFNVKGGLSPEAGLSVASSRDLESGDVHPEQEGSETSSKDSTVRTKSSSGSPGSTAMASHGNTFLSESSEVKLGTRLGGGGFGSVYEARWRGTTVAVKVFDPYLKPQGSAFTMRAISALFRTGTPDLVAEQRRRMSTDEEERDQSFLREVKLLASLRHPNILGVFALVRSPRMLVMELAPIGSLRAFLHTNAAGEARSKLSWAQRLDLASGVAAGVAFLHAQTPPIIHFDLKSDNVVLDQQLQPKVCDFGLSMLRGTDGESSNTTYGTPQYCAPEVARQDKITLWEAVDTYGFGCILFDLAHVGTNVGPVLQEPFYDFKPKPEAPKAHGAAMGLYRSTPGRGDLRSRGGSQSELREREQRWDPIQILVAREKAGYVRPVAPNVPAPLASLLGACLAVKPEDRPTQAEAMARLEEAARDVASWDVAAPSSTD